MRELFEIKKDTPMPFYLAGLPDKYFEKYKFLIENNGGIVEPFENDNILKFTLPSHAYSFKFVFSVKFIDDCLAQQKILDINDYFIGDSRLNLSCLCRFPKMICLSKSCLLNQIEASLKVLEPRVFLKKCNLKKKIFDEGPMDSPALTNSEEMTDFSSVSPIRRRAKVAITDRVEIVKFGESSDEDSDVEPVKTEIMDILESKFSGTCEKNENIAKSSFSGTSEENGRIPEPPENNKNKLSPVPTNLTLLDGIITSEIMEWINHLNKDRPKDKFGYPKKISCSYVAWESRNLIEFVQKTNTFTMIFSQIYWSDVAKLKLLPKLRSNKSMYSHFIYIVLKNIEEFRLDPKVEDEFVRCRKLNSEERKKLSELQKTKILSKRSERK